MGGYQLSIILPTYNRQNLICRAIESVLIQDTEINYELIVINDGSTDKTRSVLRKYEKNPRVKIINQDNKGFSGARNTGIDIADGNYLMFIDDDDCLEDGAIDRLMATAQKNDADVVEGSYVTIFSDGRHIAGPKHANKKVFPLGNLQGFFWGKVYKHDCFKGIRLPEGYWYEDSLNAQILWRVCKRCYTISDCVYQRYEHAGSITNTSRRKRKSIDSFYITQKLLSERKKHGFPFEQPEYEYFLRMVKLTFERTKYLDGKVARYIYILWRDLIKQYFQDFKTEDRHIQWLEEALRRDNYRLYILRNVIGR